MGTETKAELGRVAANILLVGGEKNRPGRVTGVHRKYFEKMISLRLCKQ
jgi:hypothetical protein